MVNFVMMDILSDDTYVNYFLLLIMLSLYALLSFKEWLLITGSTAGIIITLILFLHLDIINIYYVTMLLIGAGFLSRALYTSHVKAILSGYNLEKDNKLLQEQCLTDSLTGLLNRRGFCIKSKELWEHCKHYNRHISVIFIDVDLFKHYNDYYGHQRGDECLIQIARCIDKFAKKGNNVLSRYGGEEFLLLIDGISNIEAITLARLIKDGVEDLKILSPYSPVSEYLTVSIGLTVAIPSDGITMDELLQQTDKNLYTAKNNGRNMLIHNLN
jgi:diguanylate cyclase (GGDEF)-like protein